MLLCLIPPLLYCFFALPLPCCILRAQFLLFSCIFHFHSSLSLCISLFPSVVTACLIYCSLLYAFFVVFLEFSFYYFLPFVYSDSSLSLRICLLPSTVTACLLWCSFPYAFFVVFLELIFYFLFFFLPFIPVSVFVASVYCYFACLLYSTVSLPCLFLAALNTVHLLPNPLSYPPRKYTSF